MPLSLLDQLPPVIAPGLRERYSAAVRDARALVASFEQRHAARSAELAALESVVTDGSDAELIVGRERDDVAYLARGLDENRECLRDRERDALALGIDITTISG